MTERTITLPDELTARAESAAAAEGRTLSQMIAALLESAVPAAGPPAVRSGRDPLFEPGPVIDDDGPDDMALNHDFYLYGPIIHNGAGPGEGGAAP